MTVGGVIFFGTFFYWIASIRAYFGLFPMGPIRGPLALFVAIVLSWILMPLGWVVMFAIGQPMNGC